MNISAQQLFDECGKSAYLLKISGNTQVLISGMSPAQSAKQGDIVFAPDKKACEMAIKSDAVAIVVGAELEEQVLAADSNRAVLTSASVALSHALVKQKYLTHDYSRAGLGAGVHPRAIVHESVHVPETAFIGPGAVIEKDAIVGNKVQIMANATVEHGATVGDGSRIHQGAVIGWGCIIGNNCIVGPNSVIGGEGFGFTQDQNFNHHPIPHTGHVHIEDNVTISALCTVDRATYGTTRVGSGTIMGNLCHIAHNVSVGEKCILISGLLCGGSTTIGDRVIISGGGIIKDHVEICSDVYLMHRPGVLKNITKPGMYAGAPVLMMEEYAKKNAVLKNLPELSEDVQLLKKELAKIHS